MERGRSPKIGARSQEHRGAGAWRGAALALTLGVGGICSMTCLAEARGKQAAPTNDPTRRLSLGLGNGIIEPTTG